MSSNDAVKERCQKGHFYNKLRYSSCPYCAKLNAAKSESHNPESEEGITGDSAEHSVCPAKIRKTSIPTVNPPESSSESIIDAPRQKNELPDNHRTVSFYSSDLVEPIVGWLVCISGRHRGECFNLYTGRNEIGRGVGMDISLPDEQSISKKTHAVLVFEPRHRTFYIQSGDSHGLTYLNGEVVMSHSSLATRDILMLGDVFFVFVALCDAYFDWNDTEKYCR